jgi:hypothetical protein
MNALRVQINNERGLYVGRDALEDKLEAIEVKLEQLASAIRGEFRSQGEAIRSEARIAIEKVSGEQVVQNRRLGELENKQANLDGRFAVLAGLLAVAVLVVQFVAHLVVK